MEYFTHSISDEDDFDLQPDPEVGPDSSPINDHDDIDVYLNRPRSYGYRRNKPLEEAPEFVKRLNAFEEVPAGCTVVFECQWKAFPKPTVKWYKDDEEIPAGGESCHLESDDKGRERLIMLKGAKRDEGAYKCKVENQEGVASTTGYLSISGDIVERTLASQSRNKHSEHSVSSAPLLRSIKEQRSLEEREWEETQSLSPSPLQEFLNNFRRETTESQMAQLGYADVSDPVLPLSTASSIENLSEIETDVDSTSISSDTSIDSQDFERVSVDKRCQEFNEAPPVQQRIDNTAYHDENAQIRESEETDKEDIVFCGNQTDSEKIENLKNTKRDSVSPCSSERSNGFLRDSVSPCSSEKSNGVFASARPMIIDRSYRLHENTDDVIGNVADNTEDVITKDSNFETMDEQSEIEHAVSQPIDAERENVVPHLRRHRRSLTPATQRLIDEMPENMSRMLGDQLQMPWVYYFAFSSCCASYAAATELNPIYLVLFVGIVSLISFHYITGSNKR